MGFPELAPDFWIVKVFPEATVKVPPRFTVRLAVTLSVGLIVKFPFIFVVPAKVKVRFAPVSGAKVKLP